MKYIKKYSSLCSEGHGYVILNEVKDIKKYSSLCSEGQGYVILNEVKDIKNILRYAQNDSGVSSGTEGRI